MKIIADEEICAKVEYCLEMLRSHHLQEAIDLIREKLSAEDDWAFQLARDLYQEDLEIECVGE